MSQSVHTTNTRHTQAGNAVTLTLLGLAVAILAGVLVLYIVGKQRPVPVPVTQPEAEPEPVPEAPKDPRAGWNTFEDADYHFSLQYPSGWIVATDTLFGVPVVTVYAAGQSLDASSTLGVHGLPTRVSIYPEGFPMGGQGDVEQASTLELALPADVRAYTLGPGGSAWATVVRFTDPPEQWSDAGYIIAQAYIQDEKVRYMRGDTEIDESEFDPLTGDRMVREGFVDPQVRAQQDEILRSFTISVPDDDPLAAFIHVTSPTSGVVIVSPLMVTGEAKGAWYFEGSFPIELRTASGELLASVPAIAEGDWMSEDFVPFSVALTFGETTATSGTLVLKRDNPSGLPDQDVELSIPVRFKTSE